MLPLPTIVSNAEKSMLAHLPILARMQELWWYETETGVCGVGVGFDIRLVRDLAALEVYLSG